MSPRSWLLLFAVAAVIVVALVVLAAFARTALRAPTANRRALFGVATVLPVTVIVTLAATVMAVAAEHPTPRVLAAVSQLHPQFRPLHSPDTPPPSFPPIEVTTDDRAAPGSVLFSTYTRPQLSEDLTFYPSFITEIDKASGDIVRTQRMYSATTMFQPEPGDRYSYNVVDKEGVAGAGIEVTHYVTDDQLNVLAEYDLADLGGGDADLHDFELLDNGNAVLLAYRRRALDLSAFGGPRDGFVWDTVIAERTPDGETVWLWDGAEHMDLGDVPAPVAQAQFPNAGTADYAHPNSLDVFDDGDVLVSIRHYDCLYRIDRDTGDIVWTFGGPNCVENDFAITGDPHEGFSHQHDATVLDNGNILLFDNGNLRENPTSRVVEYAIDEDAMTAELVWSHEDGRYTAIMGSAERLDNGNTLISWGELPDPAITEVTEAGEMVFSLSVPDGQLVYRAYQGDGR